MAEIIKMPKMSDTMEEGVIASWRVKVGDKVKSGDILAEVETDKATMELESFEDGTILHLGVKEKEAVKINGVIAIIGKEGENISDVLKTFAPAKATVTDIAPAASIQPEPMTKKINAAVITMPKMSDTMTEGVIANWMKKVGDTVKAGEIIAEVETDKATMELEAYESGKLLYIGVEAGSSIAIDGVIAVIGEEGADYKTLLEERKGGVKPAMLNPVPVKPEAKPAVTAPVLSAPVNGSAKAEGGRIKASPLAKRLAKELGYSITSISGSGEGGRIVKRDVESFTPEKSIKPETTTTKAASPSVQLPTVVGEESYNDIALSQMRKTIARRLSESKFTAPHFYLTMEINMDKAVEARASINELSPVKVSYNDLVVKATAAALRMNPKVNVSWRGDTLRMNNHINIGVAVAVEEGLLVPVVRFADNKSLSHIAAEVKTLADKAAKKQLQPADWEGSTFTISNLGMFGIEEFTAIINPPDACILAVGGIKQTPVVKNGQVVPGNVMKVTLSCDHRAVDGAVGAAFLKTLKGLLEDPVRILI